MSDQPKLPDAVPASEFTKNFGQYRLRAERKAVPVSSHGRISGYFVAAHEYERLKQRDREVLKLEELDEETVKGILNAKMPEGLSHLDDELPPDWTP